MRSVEEVMFLEGLNAPISTVFQDSTFHRPFVMFSVFVVWFSKVLSYDQQLEIWSLLSLSLFFFGKFWRNFDLGPKSISNWYPIFRSISDFNVYDWLIVTTFTDFGLYLFSSNVYFLVIARRSSRSMSVSIGMSWARAWMYNGVMIGVDG